MTEGSARAAEAVVDKLNSVVSTAVTVFNDSRFIFVDPTASGSPFLNHELCRTSGAFFNGLNLSLPSEYTFHPNADGQAAYKQLIAGYLS